MRAAERPQSDDPRRGRPPSGEPSADGASGDAASDRAPEPGADDRSRRPRWLTSAALLAVAAVLLTVGWASRHDRPVGDRTVGEVTRVGIAAGAPVPGYLAAARAELAGLPAAASPAGTYALVSFSAYVPPDGLAGLLAGVSVAEVVVRAPLPGRQTEIVRLPAQRLPRDVLAGMTGLAERKDREAADYAARAAGAADPELRRQYDTGAQVAAGEAAAYRTGCACAYAALVRAAPDALRALAVRPRVRAVDPAPELVRLDRAVLTPPLPEQRDVARPPVDDGPAGVPAPGAGETSEAAPRVPARSPAGASAAPGAGPPGPATSPDAAGD
ncbi:hypothetical protein ACFY2R_08240 [Micromonospora olivasterospora]|uniref:Uncharacterized protein n=1 Tax=Micromonospora olivasterospora TaxID=1880 RepID=A0A562I3M4_MICOL|nr:hypothetical protein [Micromonospora olivasterospora]TWH65651.1 hypothetical protein JD77_00589 [Micromonospora olivasterospora]